MTTSTAAAATLRIDFVSDISCPWCAIGLSALEQAVAELGHVAEGVYSARTVWQRASTLGVPMPITQAVVGLLDGQLKAHQAVAALMGRGPVSEVY